MNSDLSLDFLRVVEQAAIACAHTMGPGDGHKSDHAAVAADERIRLLPALDFATRTRAEGRDRLYEILCQQPAARTQPVCQAPAVLERTWAHEARIHRAAPWIALHVGPAALFALAVCLLRYIRGKDSPAPTMSVVATAASAAALAWIVYAVVTAVHAWTTAWDRLC